MLAHSLAEEGSSWMNVIGPGLPEDYENAAFEGVAGGDRLPCKEARVLKGHEGPVFAVRFTKTGNYCVTCGKDRNIILWNPHNGVRIKTYVGHGYDVRDACVSADNSKFASCGGDKQVFLWDVSTARFIRKFRGHDAVVNAVTYAANDDLLVTAGYDQCVKVWDCKSRSIDAIQTMKVFQDSVTSVAVHGHDIVAASVDGTVRRFDVRLGRTYADDVHHPVTSIALSHDGQCVLAACLDSTLRLLDKSSGELLATYEGHVHQSLKLDCCLTPSDAHVVCGSETGEVLYWDLVEANVVRRFRAHAGVVCSVAMHPDGAMLLTSSVDGSVKQDRRGSSGYLLPSLMYGPNNQLAQLHQALTLAHALDRTFLLTGIFDHHSDEGKMEDRVFYPFDSLFDRSQLQKALRVATVPEATAQGWDGGVDAALGFEGQVQMEKPGNRAKWTQRLGAVISVNMTAGVELEFNASVCSARGMKELKERLREHRTVHLYPGSLHHDLRAYAWPCNKSFALINAAVRRAPGLRRMAERYVEEELGGEPFIAAHVRPYPDTCMKVWSEPGALNATHLSGPVCKNGRLLHDLAPRIEQTMRKWRVQRVFILSHPHIRWRLDNLLKEANITPTYLSPDALSYAEFARSMPAPQQRTNARKRAPMPPPRDSTGSKSLLLFAEQEVALHAKAFIGSRPSSATWTVVYARAAELQRQPGATRGRWPEDRSLDFFEERYPKKKEPRPQQQQQPGGGASEAGAGAQAKGKTGKKNLQEGGQSGRTTSKTVVSLHFFSA